MQSLRLYLLTSSAVASRQASENAQRIFRRYRLQDLFEKSPGEALAKLHQAFVLDGGEEIRRILLEHAGIR